MRNGDISQIIPGQAVERYAFLEHNYTWEQVLRVLRKHVRFALLVAGSLSALIVIYAMMQKSFYSPTARLEISPPNTGISTLHEIESANVSDNQDYLETQVQILGSDALAVSVIRELHLENNPEFVNNKTINETSAVGASSMTRSAVPGELVILLEQLDLATLTPAESAALEQFRRKLSVSSVRNTRLVEIRFSSHDPQLAQMVTNTLVVKFIDQNYKNRYTTTMQASEWLSAQLNDLRKKVDQSAQAAADYQKKTGLVEVDDRDVPISQLMGEVNHQLGDAQASRIENEAFVRMIDEGHGDAVPVLRDDKLYQDLMGKYTDLRGQLAQARAVYGDENVNVKKLLDQLTEVSIQIDAERKRAISRARATYLAAKHREELMLQERQKVRAQMGHMTSQLTAYHMLRSEAGANAELYNTLQGRLREAGIYAGLRSSNIRVVDLATNLRKPTGPHRTLLVALGTFASCLFAGVLVFLREGFRNTVRTPDDVKSWVGMRSLALLPAMGGANAKVLESGTNGSGFNLGSLLHSELKQKQEQQMVEIMRPPTMESEAMRDLRTSLLHANMRDTPSVILISSSVEGEGKTTVAVNFAVALAQLGKTCLLEADLRQPSVARVFDIHHEGGLTDVLQGSIPLANALVPVPWVENLTVLSCGTIPESPADVLSLPQMTYLLNTLKDQFDYVVIDSPPIIRFSDARFLSALADEVVLVGRYGVTTRRAIQRSAELLKEMNASVAGVVLNAIDFSSPDYHYYSYGYSNTRFKLGPPASGNGEGGSSKNTGAKPGAMSAHA